jgi:hypothetical protein
MIATLTDQTCGEACWAARESICRCSCGGKNHGILQRDGERPERSARIKGRRYVLAAIGGFMEIRTQAHTANEDSWRLRSMHVAEDAQATSAQQTWPEVQTWMETNDSEIPRLLWIMQP